MPRPSPKPVKHLCPRTKTNSGSRLCAPNLTYNHSPLSMPTQGLLMKKFSALLIACLASLGAHAESPLDYDVSGQFVYTQVKAAGETFSPRLFQVKAGVSLNESLFSGIGIQGQYATPISDSTKGNLTVDIESQSGVFVTLVDPDTDPESLK